VYPVTQDFLDKMKADRRRVLARVAIDYTDPFIDQSIRIEASEQANVSYPQQTADSVYQTTCKYACLDGTWDLTSGEYHLAPSADQLAQRQFGWWGAQFCDQDGYFVSPYPTLTVRHSPRPMRQLKVVGDTARGEYPVDFTVKLYGPDDTLLKTETVTGNDQASWQKALEPQVPDVAKQVLEITKWSLPGTCAKIIEFFTSIREVYETGDLVSLRLLEEREASQGSLPVGNISSNEITLALNNESKKFDVDNDQSPLKNLLKPNRRIQAWLGLKGGSEGMNIQRNVDFSQGELNNLVVVNNKLQLPDVGGPSFSRNSTAYLSDGTLVNTNFPRFEPGRFGEAVMVEEGTTNKILYSEEFDRSNWAKSGVIITANSETAPNGTMTADKMVEGTSTGNHIINQSVTMSSTSAPVAVSVYVKPAGRTKLRLYVVSMSSVGVSFDLSTMTATNYTGDVIYKSIKSVGNGWYRLEFAGTASFDSTNVWAVIALLDNSGNFSYTGDGVSGVYIWGMQFEEKQYPTTYMATISSTATRSPETLTIPAAGVLNPQEGTIECWVYEGGITTKSGFFWDVNRDSSDRPQLYRRGDSQYELFWDGYDLKRISCLIPPIGWHYLVVKWAETEIALYLDGVFVGDYTLDNPAGDYISGATDIHIGCRYTNTAQLNSLIDDLRISSCARSDDEILAAYQSGQPLPVDEWTTYKLGFDGNLNFGQGGYYISPEYDLSAVGTAATSAITWQEDADGVQRTVYAKLDNQSDWTQVQNGGKLPISTGSVLTGRKLQIKTKLIRCDADVGPEI
jgi:hypothetical protein